MFFCSFKYRYGSPEMKLRVQLLPMAYFQIFLSGRKGIRGSYVAVKPMGVYFSQEPTLPIIYFIILYEKLIL